MWACNCSELKKAHMAGTVSKMSLLCYDDLSSLNLQNWRTQISSGRESCMHGLLVGQTSFLLRAATDNLPIQLSLRQQRLRADTSFPQCGHKQPNIYHILSNYPEVLLHAQGRYTWQHDYAVQTLSIKGHLDSETKVYVDLPGMRASESPVSIIPEYTSTTSVFPKIFLIHV